MKKFFAIALVAMTMLAAEAQSAGHINRRTNINIRRPVGSQRGTIRFRRTVPIQRRFFVPGRTAAGFYGRNAAGFFDPNLSTGFYRRSAARIFDPSLGAGFYDRNLGSSSYRRSLGTGIYDPNLSQSSRAGSCQSADGFQGFASQDPGLPASQSYEYHYFRSSAPLRAGSSCK